MRLIEDVVERELRDSAVGAVASEARSEEGEVLNSAHIEEASDIDGCSRGEGEVLECSWVLNSGRSSKAVRKGGSHSPAALSG